MSTAERHIDDLFDDILLTEERLSQQSYEEGFEEGKAEGNLDGYKLGYAQGVQLGEELGEIYGVVVAHLQIGNNAVKVHKLLIQLKGLIEEFPRTNDPEVDIIQAIENIRSLNKRVRAMLHLPLTEAKDNFKLTTDNKTAQKKKDYTF